MAETIRTFCAFLLLFGASWATAVADTPKPLTAILLIARAELPDPNFRNSVVLVTNEIERAPVGVIINRPTTIPVARLFPDLGHLARLEDKLYFGGPVDTGAVSFVFRAESPAEHAIRIGEGVYLSTNRALLLRLLGRDKPMEGLRIFVGFSGWAPGQLEAEIANGDWTLAPADAAAIFGGQPEHLWRERHVPKSGSRT